MFKISKGCVIKILHNPLHTKEILNMAHLNTLFSQVLSLDPQTCFSETGSEAQNRTRFPQIWIQRTVHGHGFYPTRRKALHA